jgi:hypothetical protein
MTNAIRLTVRESGAALDVPAVEGLRPVIETATLTIEAGAGIALRTRADGSRYLIVGHVIGVRDASGDLGAPAAAIAALDGPDWGGGLDRIEGRFLLVDVAVDGTCRVWADRFGQRDLYFQTVGAGTALATRLDLLPIVRGGAQPDQMAFAHALTVYGFRPPKRHTFYEGVRRMGVDESVEIADGRVRLVPRAFVPIPTGAYGDAQLQEYTDILIEAIRARASSAGNVIYLSSGWDSTAILACLVHLFGNRGVRAIVGRMVYADRSGVINQFEIDRARRMCEFFGINLGVVDFDYRTTAPAQIERVRPALRTQQMAGITALNHWILAEFAASTGTPDEVLFAGEMSDGAHNLGFSQYATYFHPEVEFREYFDKMAGYLHSPAFLKLLQRDAFRDDPIYRLMRDRVGAAVFDEPAPDAAGRARQLVASCLLRSVRVPLWSLANTRLLTARGRDRFIEEIELGYLGEAGRAATPETLYAWVLHLYNSLHWQGSTVATIPVTAELHGRHTALPYHDARLQDFLSAMPEVDAGQPGPLPDALPDRAAFLSVRRRSDVQPLR